MIYLLIHRSLTTIPKWDCVQGIVVRAKSSQEARQIASENKGVEGRECWLDFDKTSCERLFQHGPSEVILKDFKAG